jgi:hypothetical protein
MQIPALTTNVTTFSAFSHLLSSLESNRNNEQAFSDTFSILLDKVNLKYQTNI